MEIIDAPYISVTDAIASHAKWRSIETAVICGDMRLTWREFNERINRVANGLISGGLTKGDKVSALMPNAIETVEIIMGTIKAGGVIVPLSTMLTGDALAMMINDSDSKLLFADQSLIASINPLKHQLPNIPENGYFATGFETGSWTSYQAWRDGFSAQEPCVGLRPEDDFNIIYSSGTTGVPKDIVHTHYARQQFAFMLGIEFRFDPNSTAILTTPIYSNGTWMVLLPALTIGATAVIMRQFGPKEFLELVQRESCTHTLRS